jgi:hypothetical protein
MMSLEIIAFDYISGTLYIKIQGHTYMKKIKFL